MSTFDEELQIILDRHPEIDEVRVKYKKSGTVFKPRYISQAPPKASMQAISSSAEAEKVAEMIRNGELT